MSEELGLHQRFGDGPAVDRDERAAAARALLVDCLRDQLFSGSALSGHHHGRQAVGGLADRVEQIRHLPALPDEALEAMLPSELGPERLILVLEALALEGVGDDQLDLVELEGLRDVVVRAQLHRLDGGLGGGERGDHEHHRVRRVLLGGAQDRQAVDLSHSEIGDDEVERLALEHLDGLLAALGQRDLVTRLLEHDREELAHAPLVVDDQNPSIRHGETAG